MAEAFRAAGADRSPHRNRSWRRTRGEPSVPGERRDGISARTSTVRDLGSVLLIFLTWRGMLFGFDPLVLGLVVPGLPRARFLRESLYWGGWVRWDGDWYHRIAEVGYAATVGPAGASWAFFPLFPYATRALAATGLFGSLWAAGLVLTNLALAGALTWGSGVAVSFEVPGPTAE